MRSFRGRLPAIVSTSNFETHKSSLSHGRIAAQRSFDFVIYGDNPNNKWRLTKPEWVLNPNQCLLALIAIFIRVKAAAWRFNQLNNCVLSRKALCWPYLVPREILSAFYSPLQTNSLSSRKSTQQGANKFYSSTTLASATEAFFMAHVPGRTWTSSCSRYCSCRTQSRTWTGTSTTSRGIVFLLLFTPSPFLVILLFTRRLY